MNRSRFLIALGTILCLVLPSLITLILANTAQAQPADAPWPIFGRNPQHTSRSPYIGPETPVLKWSDTRGKVGSSLAIGTDGTIYIGSSTYDKLYAINPGGTLEWSYTPGGPVESSPTIGADSTIYVGSNDNKLYAINADGTLKWSFNTTGEVRSSPAIGGDGTIYVGSSGDKLYAITEGESGGSGGGLPCFIATAAYGTPTAEQIDVLREFRDIVLLKSTVGSEFVTLYYQLSPPIADFIVRSDLLKTLVRELLVDPVVWIVEATGDIWRN